MYAWEQAATADSGLTYTLTNLPLGHAEVRDGKNGPVLMPGTQFDDWADFTWENAGATIRFPSNRTRTFANGLWVRSVPTPTTISLSVAPSLKPDNARVLLVYQAAADWAAQGGLRDPGPYLAKLQRAAWGDPMNPGDTGLLGSVKQTYYGQGLSAAQADQGVWYRAPGWR